MTPGFYIDIVLYAGCVMILSVHTAVVSGIIRAGIRERKFLREERPDEVLPTVSLIIPARDEEVNLPGLFRDIESQDTEGFNVVFVNDRSKDRTSELLEAFKASHPDRVTVVHLTENPNQRNPKQYALGRGVEAADGEVLLLTDADCRFSARWVRRSAEAFRNEKLGLVFGPVVTETEESFLHRYQAFDHLFRSYYTSGAAGLGLPAGGFGNNMAVRKAALIEAGGFDGLPYSPTEDAALISAVRDRTAWKIAGFVSARTLVVTAAENSWKRLSDQELRWNAGGIFAPDATTRLTYRLVMFYLTAGVILLPFSLIYLPMALTAASAFLSMFMVAVAAGFFGRGTIRKYFRSMIPCLLISMGYYSLMTIFSLTRKPVTWKGEVLERN